ncbi:GDP-L-fucose synthase family protein [Orenia metallireducens]
MITGGNGFLGKAVVKKLKNRECTEIFIPKKEKYDLTKETEVQKLFKENKNIDIIIHLAADVGGIGYNRSNPGSVYYNNVMMNTLLMEYSRLNNVSKFIGIGSVCSYPKYTEIPFKEKNLWKGYPEETNAPYGLSKKMMLEQGKAYKEQYDFNAVHLLMINLYGPEDNFDLESSHVIPALIRKFVEAKENNKEKVIAWGDGSPTREFLYVDDAAEGILLAAEKYNKSEPVNLGSGMEISIKKLTEKIAAHVGFEGEIDWDISKPNGQPRRCLDISKSRAEFDFEAKISFDEGLKRTIEWYKENFINNTNEG